MADSNFVDLPLTVTASALEDKAVARLQATWPDFTPNEADPETTWIEAIVPLATDLAAILAAMPQGALIAFGTKLLGQPYETGASAYTSVQFTVQDGAGYTINALQSALSIDGFGFVLTQDVVVPPGSTTGVGLVASTNKTAAANGLTGTDVQKLSMPGFVIGMSVLAPTYNGVDPQTDDDYASQVSRDRRLNSRAIIVPLDYELAALDIPGIARAHAEPDTGNPRQLDLTIMSTVGGTVPTPTKTTLANFLAANKTANATVVILDPIDVPVSVQWTVQADPGYDTTTLTASINAALTQELSPLTTGIPSAGDAGDTTWISDSAIFVNRLIQVIGEVAGVHRVASIVFGPNQQIASLNGTLALVPTTSLPAGTSFNSTLPIGTVITLRDPTGVHTQAWTLSAQANPEDSSFAVTSQTPNFAYPIGSAYTVASHAGDLGLPWGIAAVAPTPGTFNGTFV